MNDFTKDELKIIQWEINTAVIKLDMSSLSSEKHSELNEKIKYMIDNYCEHEWRRSAINAIYCPYCQKHVEYQE